MFPYPFFNQFILSYWAVVYQGPTVLSKDYQCVTGEFQAFMNEDDSNSVHRGMDGSFIQNRDLDSLACVLTIFTLNWY